MFFLQYWFDIDTNARLKSPSSYQVISDSEGGESGEGVFEEAILQEGLHWGTQLSFAILEGYNVIEHSHFYNFNSYHQHWLNQSHILLDRGRMQGVFAKYSLPRGCSLRGTSNVKLKLKYKEQIGISMTSTYHEKSS